MGYRSEVLIVIPTKLLEGKKLPEFLEEKEINRKEHEALTYFQVGGVKYYESYPDIKELESFMQDLGYENYAFIRVGEDYDDVETNGELEHEAWISREIVLPFG